MKHLFYYVLVSVTLYDIVVLHRIIKNKKRKIKRIRGNISEILKPREVISVEEMWVTRTTEYAPWVTTKPPRGGGGEGKVRTLPPYFGFLTNICNALISPKFKGEHINKYLSILSNSLEGLGIDYLQKIWIKRLRKTMKKYTKYSKNIIKSKVNDFLVFISDEKPKKNEYFKTMDAIYTVRDDMKMDEYVYMLKRYGKGTLKHIGDNTRRVFERIVFGRFHRQPGDVKRYIELKFKSAVVEYWEERLNGTAFNFTLGHLFNFTFSQP